MSTDPPTDRPGFESGEASRLSRRLSGSLAEPGMQRLAIIAVAITLAVAIAMIELVGPHLGQSNDSSSRPELRARAPGYLVSASELRHRALLAGQGVEPYATALDDLIRFAEASLLVEPDPQEPLDIPGTEGPFVDDTAAAYGLALAYAVTDDLRFARHAARIIMAWVGTTRTLENACPSSGSCQTSLIVSRNAPAFVFAADLLRDSPAMTAGEAGALHDWLADVVLPVASDRDNNWGDAGIFSRAVITDFLGDTVGLSQSFERWRLQQDLVAADGHIPEETRRGSAGMTYTQEALQYRIGVAVIAERHGVDLWSYRGAGGATLRTAIDHLARYWDRPDEWPWHRGASTPAPGPIWEIAYARFGDPAYVPMIEARRPFGSHGHSAIRWTTLTNGVPLAIAAPGSHPADPTAVATPTPSHAAPSMPAPSPAVTPTPPGPSVDGPVLSFMRGGRLSRDTVPVRIRWDVERHPIPIVRYRLDASRGGAGSDRLRLSRDDATAATHSARIDRAWRYRVRATDAAGRTGAWAYTDPVTPSLIGHDGPDVTYAGTWGLASHPTYRDGTVRYAIDAGAEVTLVVTARAVAWIGPVGPTRGRAVVLVDGRRAGEVDLHRSRFAAREVLFVASWPEVGDHTVLIRVIGSGPAVAVDSFAVLD